MTTELSTKLLSNFYPNFTALLSLVDLAQSEMVVVQGQIENAVKDVKEILEEEGGLEFVALAFERFAQWIR
jgi:hypothetical protein